MFQPLYALGKRMAQIIPRFNRVVENDYRAVARISLDNLDDLFGREIAVIVAGDDVIHYNAVVLLDFPGLIPHHQSVWRPEEMAVDQTVGFGNVTCVAVERSAESRQMMHGVIAERVPSPLDFLQQFGVASNIVTDKKKGGFHVIFVEHIKHPRRHLGNRSVVESQVGDLAPASRNTPDRLRKQ